MSIETTDLHPSLASKADFSDRWSPMIVKELRQGLRTRAFISIFIGLQALLGLMILISAGSSAYDSAGSQISGTILLVFLLAGLLLQPLRGTSAVANEIKQDTIDLMSLTKLSAWKIVLGKWLSLASQTTLLFITVLPYLVFRYFFGGMEVVAEVLALFSLYFLSLVLTAITVGLSANTMPLVRFIVPVLGIPMLLMSMTGIYASTMRGGSSFSSSLFRMSDAEDFFAYFGALGFAAYLAYYFLEMGATTIAPLAENRATRKRLIAIAVLILTLIVFHLYVDDEVAGVMATLICFLIGFDVLTEPRDITPSITIPFLKRKSIGRISGRFLYPGWPSGLLFYAICCIITATYCIIIDDDIGAFSLIMIYASLFPCAVAGLFQIRIMNLLSIHVIVWLCSVILMSIVGILGGAFSDSDIFYLILPLPFGAALTVDDFGEEGIIILFSVLSLALWIICLMRAMPVLKNYAAIEKIGRQALENDD